MGRVRRNGSVLSSISSRISAVAFTRVTKMRTIWRNTGIMTSWNRRMVNLSTRAAASETVKMIGTTARSAVAMTRRVPRRYRNVRSVTTQAFRKDSVQSIRSPDEIPEDGVETVVRALEPLDLELRVRDDLRKLSIERVRLAGAHEERIGRGELERDHVFHPGEGLRQFRALAHPAAVSSGRSLRRAREADDLQGGGGLLAGLPRRHPIEPQQGLDELLSCEPSVELILFRTVAEAPLQSDVVPRVLAEQRDLALVGMELPDEELEQRALARAVRSHEPGDSLAEGRREGIEAEHLAIPLRDGRGLDDAVHPVITSTALIRIYVTTDARTVTPSNTASAASQSIAVGVAPNATLATAT